MQYFGGLPIPRPMREVAHQEIKVKNGGHAKNVIAEKSKSQQTSYSLVVETHPSNQKIGDLNPIPTRPNLDLFSLYFLLPPTSPHITSSANPLPCAL